MSICRWALLFIECLRLASYLLSKMKKEWWFPADIRDERKRTKLNCLMQMMRWYEMKRDEMKMRRMVLVRKVQIRETHHTNLRTFRTYTPIKHSKTLSSIHWRIIQKKKKRRQLWMNEPFFKWIEMNPFKFLLFIK